MSDFLQALIEAEKSAMAEAPAAAKQATWAALEASIARGAPAPVDVPPPGPGGLVPFGWLGVLIGSVGVILAGVWMAMQPAPAVAPPPAAPPPIVEVAPPPPPEVAPPPPVVKQRRARPKRRPRASLADQIAALRSAHRALSEGAYAEAASKVRAHRRRFPASPLVQERDALEVLAACGGQEKDAGRLARRFLRRWPRSPQADRIRRACELEAP